MKKVIKRIFLSKISTNLIFPAIAALPPVLVSAGKAEKGEKAWPDWFFSWFNPLLHDHPSLGFLFACWAILLILVSYALGKFRDFLVEQDQIGEKHLSLIFEALETPVGEKLSRFGKVAKRVLAESPKPSAVEAFREITMPEQQIALLVKSLHIVFQNDVEIKEDLKVVLARMEKGRVVRYEHYLPHGDGPRSRPEDLKHDECGFNHAAKIKDLLIIPDIAKELSRGKHRRFSQVSGNTPAEGSMICFPVVDTELDLIPFVISIKYSQKNHFTEGRKRRYRYVLRTFAERIALENRLHIIKEATKK